LQSSTYIKGL